MQRARTEIAADQESSMFASPSSKWLVNTLVVVTADDPRTADTSWTSPIRPAAPAHADRVIHLPREDTGDICTKRCREPAPCKGVSRGS